MKKSFDDKQLNSLFYKGTNKGESYVNYSYALFYFIEKLYQEIMNSRIKNIYFLSREGEFLKKLFDEYCIHAKDNLELKSNYLYVSRQSTFPASLNEDISEENFSRLFCQFKNLSIKAFLKNIGFLEKDIEHVCNELQCDFEKIIIDFDRSNEFSELIGNLTFRTLYANIVRQSKANLQLYLKDNNFFAYNEVAIIDVGWKGSIQDNISLACDKSIVIKGYYIGLSGDVYTDIFNQKKGILFADYPIKSVHYDIWSFDSHFFERLLTASHASVRTYRNKDGNVIPIYNEHGQEKNNYILIKPIQDKILLQSDRLYEHFRSLELTSSEKEKLMAKYHITALTHVNASNMKLQFELLYGQEENFGVQSSNKNIFKEALSFLNLLKQIRKKYKMIKNPVLIMEILNSKGLYFLSALIIRLQERKLRKLL